jgi:membrane protease YdiL (CAAX protease family)
VSDADWRPWPAWPSLGFAAVLMVLYQVAQAVVALATVVILAVLEPTGGLSWASIQELFFSRRGFLLAVSVIVTAPVFSVAVVALARLRGPVREYLALRWAPGWTGWRRVAGWGLAVAAFLYAFDSLGTWLGRPPVPDFMRDVYTTAEPRVLLWVALVLAAPLFEELLFRGFLLPGLASSWGAPVAVAVSSLLFAASHFQYDPFDMTAVLGLGLLLGAARVTTRSTLLPMVLHAGVNLAVTVQTHRLVGG